MTAVVRRRSNTVGDGPLYEVIHGVTVDVPPMSVAARRLAKKLATGLNDAARAKQAGIGMIETLYRIDGWKHQRRPDVSFVTHEKLSDELNISDGALPDIVVEVVEKKGSANAFEQKLAKYLAAGIALIWVVYPNSRRVYVYRSAKSCCILELGDTLDGGTVLPEFRLPLAMLFERP